MSTKTALVVDDSKSARFALRKYLEGHSFKVETAESAQEAFAFLKNNHPDLIFLDHVMPGLDGFEALNQIKSDPATVTIPVVICSSNEGEQFIADARNRGAADVLQKPPSPEQLLKVLDNLQRMAATLKTMAAAKPAVPPAAPSKVASIREPDVAIEQAVMKALRTSVPTTPPPAQPFNPLTTAGFMASAQVPPAAPPAFDPGATGSFNPAATGRFTPPAFNPSATGSFSVPPIATPPTAVAKAEASAQHLRADIEARMKKMTQDLFVQIAELKAGIAHLESHERSPDETEAQMRAVAQAVADEAIQPQVAGFQSQVGSLQSGIGNLQARIEVLERNVEAHFAEMRAQFEQALQQQAHRIEQIAQQSRQAAAEEAHAAAERTVMSAASRIADQLADGILTALGRKQS